jgi:hypothetical protein
MEIAMKKWIYASGVLMLLVSACSYGWPKTYSSRATWGVVTDATTGAAIADALVVVEWQGSSISMATGALRCIHVEIARTDRTGRYDVPAWEAKGPNVDGFFRGADAYKPGYESIDSKFGPNVRMQASGATGKERLKALDGFLGRNDCGYDSGAFDEQVIRLYLEVLKESDAMPIDSETSAWRHNYRCFVQEKAERLHRGAPFDPPETKC